MDDLLMNLGKLNRNFSFELNDGYYRWFPTTTVSYDFGEGRKIHIMFIDQWLGDREIHVTTVDGNEFAVDDLEVLYTHLRYPAIKR